MNTLVNRASTLKAKKQKGFTLAELVIVLVIIGILTAVVYPRVTSQRDTAKVDGALTQVQTVLEGAIKFGPRNGDKTGITMQALSERGLVPSEWGSGASAGNSVNPWNGNISVAVNASDPTSIDVTFTGIDDDEAGLLFQDEAGYNGSTSATYASGTLTATYKVG